MKTELQSSQGRMLNFPKVRLERLSLDPSLRIGVAGYLPICRHVQKMIIIHMDVALITLNATALSKHTP